MRVRAQRRGVATGKSVRTGVTGSRLGAGLALGVVAWLSATGGGARLEARPPYGDAFAARYPTSTLPADADEFIGASCGVCHVPADFMGVGNCYRRDLKNLMFLQGLTIDEALAAAETLDSDGDGVNNLAEILFPREGGRVGYNPGLVGPTGTDPCSPDPALAVSGRLETPSGSVCTRDYNRDGVLNLDDLGDFITDYYLAQPIPAGIQPDAPTYAGVAVGFGEPCPNAPDAGLPYASDAYRQFGYRVGFSVDGSNACPFDPAQVFPNLDNLNDYITAYYEAFVAGGC
jgi:hypothetical protein